MNGVVLPDLIRSRPGRIELVDLFAKVCPNGRFTKDLGGVSDARPDGVHFSDDSADWVADWLIRTVLLE